MMPQEVIRIETDAGAIFQSRPNRFLAVAGVETYEGMVYPSESVHVHDPGRLQELLFPGNQLLLKRAYGAHRKTRWDLIAADFEGKWILIHSGYHRQIAEWVLRHPDLNPVPGATAVLPEKTVGHSRLDFLATHPDGSLTGIEVKGCTLAQGATALFPDAPTVRGTKHLETLIQLRKAGQDAVLIILIFRPEARQFEPFRLRDPIFANTFAEAIKAGVSIRPLGFSFDGTSIFFERIIPLSDVAGRNQS